MAFLDLSWFVKRQTNKFQGLFKDIFVVTLLDKTRHEVIYGFYFFGYR